jgi:hypothetical protein
MQAAQYAAYALAVIVLHKVNVKACRRLKITLVKAFKKKASRVAKNFRFKNQYVR